MLSLQFVFDVIHFLGKCPNNIRDRHGAVPKFVALNVGHPGECVRLLVKCGHAGNEALGVSLKLFQQRFQVGGVRLLLGGWRYGQNGRGLRLLVRGQSGNFQRSSLGDFGISLMDDLLGLRGQIGGSLDKPLHGALADTQLIGGILGKGLCF